MTQKTPLESLLKKYFGYDSFRPGQLDVINSVLTGHDTLAVMPTGGGKSLCYQIPSLVFKGLTVVVSPLIALMQDQVAQLDEAGVPSLFLNSSLERDEYRTNMNQIRSGKVKLLYCAPETLITDRIQELLSGVCVDCLTIDEAHCISEWGHDFRPEYRRIAEVRRLFPKAVCLALTATATQAVRDDIKRTLCPQNKADTEESQPSKNKMVSIDGDWHEFVSSFNRPNIFLEVQSKAGSARVVSSAELNKLGFIAVSSRKMSRADELTLNFIANHRDDSGIIYCFSRHQVDTLNQLLNEMGVNSLPYHAGLSDEERAANQIRFVKDEVPVIVATVAFGMGINKPNVRYVIHYDLPKSLEQYYQEIGRAGRDGENSHALLLYSYADTRKLLFFMEEKKGHDLEIAQKQLKSMVDYAESRTCRRTVLLSHFGEKYNWKKNVLGKAAEPQIELQSEFDCADERAVCCDICASGKNLDIDVTVPVQKYLSCILRTGQRYGAAYVIDVLLGSRQKRIIDNKHDKLSTWGIGKEYSKDDWFEISRLLVESGFLKKSADYGVLSLTRDAHDTLKERGSVFLPFAPTIKPVLTVNSDIIKNQELFIDLKRMRKQLAEQSSVPPYVIFGDKTLEDIAIKKPRTMNELLDIYGIGEVKAERYGEFILGAVKKQGK